MTETSQGPVPAWAGELADLLGREPAPVEQLVASLREGHPEVTAADLAAHLRTLATVHETNDGWVDLRAAADGAILTTFLNETELDAGVLIADGDLELWVRLAIDGLPLASGGEVYGKFWPDTVTTADTELVGPDGWLAGFQPGQLLGLRLRDGALEIAGVPDLSGTPPEHLAEVVECALELARAGFVAYLEMRDQDDEFTPDVPAGMMAAELVATQPEALRAPLPPLSVVLRMSGLEVTANGHVSMPGLPADPDEAADLTAEELSDRIGVTVFVRAADDDDGESVDGEECARFLAMTSSDNVLDYLADLVEDSGLPEETLALLRKAATTPREQGIAALLAARAAEGDDEPARAEQLVTEAMTHQPGLVPALVDAAEYAATRGDIVAADGFLKRAGVHRDHPRRAALAGLAAPPETTTSRNQPCPCGSGRKFKVCHLAEAVHPLPKRVSLLYAKLVWWATRSPQRNELEHFHALMDHDTADPGDYLLALDLALFDRGLAEDFVEARGELLPDDEQALLERWLDSQIAPYEVVRVRKGVGVTLRPLLGGDNVELADRAFSGSVRRLDLIVARILHNGQVPCLVALPRLVPRSRRQELLALFERYQPEQLVLFFGPQPLPLLTNREGHNLVLSEAEYELPEPDQAAAWQALAQRLEETGPDELTLSRELSEDEMVVCGWVRREGPRWRVETNSVERLRDLQDLVRQAAPTARLVEESTEPAEQALRRSDVPPQPLPLPPTEVQEAMAEFIRRYEEKWLDEPVPALGGLTPRQAAAAGGESRAELTALLDDFEWHGNEHMDARRLRTALGL